MGVVKNGFVFSIAIALTSLIVGCQNKVQEENKAMWQQNRELQSQLDQERSTPKADSAQLAALQSQIAERDAKITDLQSQLRQPASGQSAADAPAIQEGGDELPFGDVEAGPPIGRPRARMAVIVLLVWNLKRDRGNGAAAKRRVHGGIIENLGDREAD